MMRFLSAIFGRSSSCVFRQNEQGTIKLPEECKLLNDLLTLIFYFLARITETISLEVPPPGQRRNHILLLKELSP